MASANQSASFGPAARRHAVLTPASEIATRRQKWLWADWIPLGALTLFAGKGGEFKSTFALDLAAALNFGELEGDLEGTESSTLLAAHEDSWGTVIVPRLKAARADLDAVIRLEVGWRTLKSSGIAIPDFPEDLPLIEEAIETTGAKLVIIDPITSGLRGDQYKVADVRAALDPLAAIAQKHEVAVIGIMHFNKGRGSTSNMLSGSHAFRDVARAVIVFASDPDSGANVLTVDKASYAEDGVSRAFTVKSVDVKTDDGEVTSVATIDKITDSEVSVSDIVNREIGNSSTITWLTKFLKRSGGAAAPDLVKAAAVADGIGWRTVERARVAAGIATMRRGYQGGTVWTLADYNPPEKEDEGEDEK